MRTLLVLFGVSLLALLTFSLSKSWVNFDRGVNINTEETPEVETEIPLSGDSLKEARVIWKTFLFYAIEPSREEGNIGIPKTLNHARNLSFVNLSTGKVQSVFEKKVYIHDFFPGDLTKEDPSGTAEGEKNGIEIGNKFILIAMTQDTNRDGYLNQKDRARVYIYDPGEEKTTDILPDNYYFDKIFLGTKKNTLVFLVYRDITPAPNKTISQIYIYDTLNERGTLVEVGEH